jgi:predicted restriction endonuclease
MLSKWKVYCSGEFKRTELVKQTRVSKYTMSIIKHLEVLLTSKPIFTEEEIKLTEKTVEDVERIVVEFEGKERDVIAKARINQGKFREILLNYWDNACAVSGLKEKKLLIASHILPWSKSTKQQQGDPFNGLLLSVVWDSLFDKGLVSFDDNGQAILEKLNDKTIECLGLNNEPYIIFPDKLTTEHKQYLNMHRMLHGFI